MSDAIGSLVVLVVVCAFFSDEICDIIRAIKEKN